MDIQMHAIKYYSFWKEPLSYEPSEMAKKEEMLSESREGHAEHIFRLRDYESR
jgi:hypothetical protein